MFTNVIITWVFKFENVEDVGYEVHYHQWLFLEAWMSVRDPNVGNDQIVIPEV